MRGVTRLLTLRSRVRYRVFLSVVYVTNRRLPLSETYTKKGESGVSGPKGGARMSMKMKDDEIMRTMSKTKRLEKSKPDSERDSGFSDASSEHLSTIDQADREDASRTGRPAVGGSRSQPSQVAVVGGSYQNLSPMIFINNVLLKQPGNNPSSLKPWGFSPSVEVVQQPQVVFLQPVVSQRGSTVPKGHQSKRRRHKKYFPILNSYPKIAPHPGDSPRSSYKSSSSRSSSSSSSSSCSTTASVKSSSSSCRDQPNGDKQQSSQSSASFGSSGPSHLPPATHLTASPQPHATLSDLNTGSCSGDERSSTGMLELPAASTDTHTNALQTHQEVSQDSVCQSGNADSSNKRKRFCNTYNILSKSGLLDITLRTKELIRQNRKTQAEVDQLREHTNLFMEALQTGDLQVWSKLQLSMWEVTEKEKTVKTESETQIDQDTD